MKRRIHDLQVYIHHIDIWQNLFDFFPWIYHCSFHAGVDSAIAAAFHHLGYKIRLAQTFAAAKGHTAAGEEVQHLVLRNQIDRLLYRFFRAINLLGGVGTGVYTAKTIGAFLFVAHNFM